MIGWGGSSAPMTSWRAINLLLCFTSVLSCVPHVVSCCVTRAFFVRTPAPTLADRRSSQACVRQHASSKSAITHSSRGAAHYFYQHSHARGCVRVIHSRHRTPKPIPMPTVKGCKRWHVRSTTALCSPSRQLAGASSPKSKHDPTWATTETAQQQ